MEGDITEFPRDLISPPNETALPVGDEFASVAAFDAFLDDLGLVVNEAQDTVWGFTRSDNLVFKIEFERAQASTFVGDYTLTRLASSSFRANCTFGLQYLWRQRLSPFDPFIPEADEVRVVAKTEDVTLRASGGVLFIDGESFEHDDRV